MLYLTHIPFAIDGIQDLNNPNAQFIEFGCATCGETVQIPTGDPPPDHLTSMRPITDR